MRAGLSAAVACAAGACRSVWSLVVAVYRRGRKLREGERAASNLLRRLYVFGGVTRSIYDREVGRVRRRRRKTRTARPR